MRGAECPAFFSVQAFFYGTSFRFPLPGKPDFEGERAHDKRNREEMYSVFSSPFLCFSWKYEGERFVRYIGIFTIPLFDNS